MLAALVCAVIYLPTLKYRFVWDDWLLITDNPRLTTGNPLTFFGQDFIPGASGSQVISVQYYRPLTVLSFWLDRQAWGLNPFGFHLTNVILNALVLLLLAYLLSLLSGRFWPVLLGLAVFGLHPTHVESVAFVSGRTDLLATAFILGCVLCLVRYGRGGRWFWLAGAGVLFAASLLSKETAILLPFVGAALLFWLVPNRRGQAVVATALLAATAAGYIVLRAVVLGKFAQPFGDVGLGQRALLFLNAFGRYAGLALFPFRHRLVYPSRAEFTAFGWPTLVGGLALILLIWLALRFRSRAFGFGAGWFLAFVVPVSNLFPIGGTFLAERLLYLPLAGIALMITAGDTLKPGFRRTGFLIMVAAFAVFGAADSIRRMPVWRDPAVLFRTMVRESPDSPDAHMNLGRLLLTQENDTAQAEVAFRRTLELQPYNAGAHVNLGEILRARGDLAGAELEFRDALALDPGCVEAHENLGIVLLSTGRADVAYRQFRLARELRPNFGPTYVNLGTCFVALNQPDSAVRSFWTAIRLQPDLAEAYENLSWLYAALGKPDSAELVNRMLRGIRRR